MASGATRDGKSLWTRWWWFLLLPLIIPAIAAVLIFGLFPASTKARNRTPREVARILRNAISGSGGEWDWDDFTSVPIADPDLEALRAEAASVSLPLDAAGRATLHDLLERVGAMQSLDPASRSQDSAQHEE